MLKISSAQHTTTIVVLALLIVSGLAWPVGGQGLTRIAFVSQRLDTNHDGKVGEGDGFNIYVMSPDGSSQSRMSDLAVKYGLSWSPDGKLIAASFEAQRGADLGLCDVEQGTVQFILKDGFVNTEPAWSPDGQFIAFTSNQGGANSQLYLIKPDGAGLRQVTREEGSAAHPTWSPDGQALAFQVRYPNRLSFIRLVDLTGKVIKELESPLGSGLEWPAISPDGKQLVCHDYRAGASSQLLLFSLTDDGLAFKVLGYGNFPAWSPDGRAIVFASFVQGLARSEICAINADGNGFKNLTQDHFVDAAPVWYGPRPAIK